MLLLGPSGSGKSTLLAALAGVVGGDEEGEQRGELLIDGEPASSIRGRAGLVLQDPDSQVILARVGDDVAFGCENLGIPRQEIWRRVSSALDAVGLHVPLDRSTSALSGGQKQRLALAGVLAMQPGLLLLDEPTANLDPAGVREVVGAVARIAAESSTTLIVVEHRVDIWRDAVDRVIVLDSDGHIIADGPTDRVLADTQNALTAAGVWLPGFVPSHPRRGTNAGGELLLAAQNLSVGHKGIPIQRHLSLEVHAGELVAITGANGAGKSTLGLTIGGLIAPIAGEVRALPSLASGAGSNPLKWKSRQLLTRIGTVFQEPEHALLTSTVRDELRIGPAAAGIPDAERRIDALLDRLRLDHLAAANPFTLSGGEKRRLSVAAALATSPAVLILDEPTFGQDARTWRELVGMIAELLDDGAAVLAITHDAAFAEALDAQTLELLVPADGSPLDRGEVAR